MNYDFKIGDRYADIKCEPGDRWYEYVSRESRKRTRPHLWESQEPDGTVVFACGLRVQPVEIPTGATDVNGAMIVMRAAPLASVSGMEARGGRRKRAVIRNGRTSTVDEKVEPRGCGVCLHAAKKREEERMNAQAKEWALSYMRHHFASPSAHAIITGITSL